MGNGRVGAGEPWRPDRRTFMAAVVASALAGAAAACSDGDAGDGAAGGGEGAEPPPLPDNLPAELFALGVASGDPLPGSVILWTRLVADPAAEDGGVGTGEPVPVGWEVASDEEFADVVASGDAVAEPALGHSVHVDADGLEPDSWYWYRFTVGDRRSPVGRTRTTPAEGAAADSLRFAFASCQNRQSGFWNAHTHLAEEDVDLVLFLGDYIYEEDSQDDAVQPYTSPAPVDVTTYRQRWAEYKADPALQAAHAARPWVCTPDDHEVANDYADDIAEDDLEDEVDPAARSERADFRDRRADAYQVYYEHMPLRLDPPGGSDFRIYRQVAWGDLARFYVLDTRQHRSDQACDDTLVYASAGPPCAESEEESRTMMGEEQEAWLGEALSASSATWNVLAQQTILSPVPIAGDVVNLDQWDGYPAARRRLVDQLRDVSNPVIITGDIHCSAVGTLPEDPDDASTPALATELVGTSISSSFPVPELVEPLVDTLDNVYYVDARQRGYVVCQVSPGELRAEFRYVSTVTEPEAEITTGAAWLVRDGDPTPTEA
jgi:alkaline phosphatase D